MVLTVLLLFVGLVALAGLAVLAIQAYKNREKAFTKVTIPPAFYKAPGLDAKAICETQPMMVGLSQQIEQAAADQAAKELASQIEYDLMGVKKPEASTKEALDAMLGYYDDKRNSDDDWSTVVAPKPKRKRKATKKKESAEDAFFRAKVLPKKKAPKKRQSKG